jgi:TP901 family phage tail tape measure protein
MAEGGTYKENLVANFGVYGLTGFQAKMAAAEKSLLGLKGVAIGVGVALAAVTVQATKVAAELDKGMRGVWTIYDDLNKKQIKQMGRNLMDLRTVVGGTIPDMTAGLYQLASAGVGSGDAIEALKASAMAAVGGMTDVETAVKAGTAALDTYGLSAKEIMRVYDQQFLAVKLGKTRYEELASAQGQFLGSAITLKVRMEELYPAFATLTKMYEPAEAATYLARTLDALAHRSDALRKVLGADMWEAGEFVGIGNAIKMISDRLGEFASTEDRIKALKDIGFDIRAAKGIAGLTEQVGFLTRALEKAEGAAGAATDAFATMAPEIGSQWERLKARYDRSILPLGEVALPVLSEAMYQAGDAADKLRWIFDHTVGAAANFLDTIFNPKYRGAAEGEGTVFPPIIRMLKEIVVEADKATVAVVNFYDRMNEAWQKIQTEKTKRQVPIEFRDALRKLYEEGGRLFDPESMDITGPVEIVVEQAAKASSAIKKAFAAEVWGPAMDAMERGAQRTAYAIAGAFVGMRTSLKEVWQGILRDFLATIINSLLGRLLGGLMTLIGGALFGPAGAAAGGIVGGGMGGGGAMLTGGAQMMTGGPRVIPGGGPTGGAFGGGGFQPAPVMVSVHEAGPWTYATVNDRYLEPRQIDRGLRMKTQGSIF